MYLVQSFRAYFKKKLLSYDNKYVIQNVCGHYNYNLPSELRAKFVYGVSTSALRVRLTYVSHMII